MKKNDYKNFDTLTILVKKSKVNEIINCYKNFGWELVGNDENVKYEDIVDLIFKRQHKIANKDELQLQQVYMEEKLNELGKLERHKNSASTAFCLFFGVLGLIALVCGVYSLISKAFINYLPIEIGLISFGVVFLLVTIIFAPKIRKKEIKIFTQRKEKLEEQLKCIYNKVSSITGGEHEDK